MPTIAEMETRTRLARLEAERLAGYLAGLSPQGWEHPTACDRWAVSHVAAHLVWIGEFYVVFVANALKGDIAPPPGSPKDARYASLPPEDFYDLTANEYRQNLGDGLLPAFTRHFEQLAGLLEGLTPDDYEKTCFYHSGNRPLWTLADLTVQELAVHAWDIQSRTEPGTPLSPESQPVLLDRVVQRPQPALALPQTAAGPARLRFELSGAVSRAYDLTLSAEATAIAPAGREPAAATLACDAETFILMLYRRLDTAGALADGRITLSGDGDLARAFAAAF